MSPNTHAEGDREIATELIELLRPAATSRDDSREITRGRASELAARGYQRKNAAIAHLKQNDLGQAEERLNEAEGDFNLVLSSFSKDASALNGLGSVEILRADVERRRDNVKPALQHAVRALSFIDAALAVDPDYASAKNDRELAVKLIEHLKSLLPE